jgi:CO dehydrogenase maturation factor
MCRAHATVRSLLGALVGSVEELTVADMEAGLEHLSRGTARHADAILAVVEPYFKSLETGRKVYEGARELGIPHVYVVANKVRTPEEHDAITAFCRRHRLQLLGTIPYDEAFAAADREGRAPIDVAPQARGIAEIAALAGRLLDVSGNGGGR